MKSTTSARGKYNHVGVFGKIWKGLLLYKSDICRKNDKNEIDSFITAYSRYIS